MVGAYPATGPQPGDGGGHVFTLSGSTWSQAAELTESNGVASDYFGYAVAISGSTVVVGALGTDRDQGVAYVFTEPASGWANMTPTAELAASDGAAGYQFASTVSISGDTVVVGSFAATVDGHEGQGAAYVFAEPASGWTNMTQTAELAASDAAAGSEFGVAVTISGNTLVVGSLFANSGHGAVYAFTGSGSGSAQTAEYIGSNSDYLGYSVAIDGNTLVSGAYGSNTVYVATDASPPTATTSLQASASLAGIGQTVTLTATVASPAVGTPTGTVTFEDNGVALPGGQRGAASCRNGRFLHLDARRRQS